MGATGRKRPALEDGSLLCCTCKHWLPPEAFPTITVRDKRCKDGHSWTGLAHDCGECRKASRREWRRKKADVAGKSFTPRGDREAWEAQRAALRAQRKAAGLARAREHARRQVDDAAALRARVRESAELRCRACGDTKPTTSFQPSRLTTPSAVICRACSSEMDAKRFQAGREALSDQYVKRMLSKGAGISQRHITPVMVEAKRIQIQIDRILPDQGALATKWLRDLLGAGPVRAVTINKAAAKQGFSPEVLKVARRRLNAIYDGSDTTDVHNHTWRIE